MTKYMYVGVGLVLAFLLIVVGVLWSQGYLTNDRMVVAVASETINQPDIGLSFAFPSGEEAFSLIESPATTSGNLLKAFVMMPTAEYFELQADEGVRETPPAMSIFVFSDDEATSTMSGTTTVRVDRSTRLQNWATRNDIFTSCTRPLAPPEITEIDGVEAVHYRADGLYQQDIYLASYRGFVYLFVTQFNAETDMTYTAFQNLIASVSFD